MENRVKDSVNELEALAKKEVVENIDFNDIEALKTFGLCLNLFKEIRLLCDDIEKLENEINILKKLKS